MTVFPIGLHARNIGASPLPYVRAINALGYGAYVKITDDTGRCNEAAAAHPDNVVMFRSTAAGDLPDYGMPPADAARDHLEHQRPYWSQLAPGVWVESINEPDKARWDWVARYCAAMARIVLEQFPHLRYAGPAANSGEPEPEQWDTEGWREYLELCADYPDRVAVSVHHYNWGNEPFEDNYPWHVGRQEVLSTLCRQWDLPVPRYLVSEWGFAYDYVPPWEGVAPFVRQCLDYYGERGMVCALWDWTLETARALEPHLVELAAEWEPPDAPEPPPPSDTWQQQLWQRSIETQTISLNPDAALQQAIVEAAPGLWTPVGSEFWQTGPDGTQRAAMAAERIDASGRRVYYAVVPDWGNVRYIEEPGDPDPPPPPEPSPIIDVVDVLPTHPTKTYGTRPVSDIDTVVIHHSASPANTGIETIARYHVNNNDWPGIGYHYCVTARGNIYQTNYLTTRSYHAGGHNGHTVGVCLIGNFQQTAPPQAQLTALDVLIDILIDRLGNYDLQPHRAFSQTACPGATWGEWFPGELPTPPPPPPPPVGEQFDLAPYFTPANGNMGQLYEVRHPDGSQERVQLQAEGNRRWIVKNSQWEELWIDGGYIWRGRDTSPGKDKQGRLRFYIQYEPGQQRARWCPRIMQMHETAAMSGHYVQFFNKDNCEPLPEFSGPAQNVITLHDHYDTWTSPYGVTVRDVVVLRTNTGEVMYFAAGLGLVAWESGWGNSAISELHAPGARPDNVRETLPCEPNDIDGDGVSDAPPPDSPAHWLDVMDE